MPTGLTKDAGWEIGVSRTLDHPVEAVWRLLVSPAGLAVWLGGGVDFQGHQSEPYRTTEGVHGELRSYRPGDRVRLTWQSATWTHDSTVQVALQAKGDRSVVRFHQERLANAEERRRQRAHWQGVIGKFTRLLDGQRRRT